MIFLSFLFDVTALTSNDTAKNLPLRGDSPGGGNVTGGDKRGALVAGRKA